MGIEDLKAQLAEEAEGTGGNGGSDEYEQLPYGRIAPFSILGFDRVEDIFFTGRISNNGEAVEQNWGGDWQDPNNGQIGITLVNPRVVVGTLFENNHREGTDDDGDTINLARFDSDAGTSRDYVLGDIEEFDANYDSDGNLKGVEVGSMNEFDASEVEEFSEDKLTIFVDGWWGLKLVQRLDTNGAVSAYVDDDGRNSAGLVEYPTDSERDDLQPRLTRYPQLRDDLDFDEHGGGFIAIMKKSDHPDYEDGANGYWSFLGYNDFDGEDITEATFIEAREAPETVEYERGATLVWHDDPSDTSEADGDTTSDSGPGFGISEDDESDTELSDEEMEVVGQFLDEIGLEEGETVADLYEDGLDGFRESLDAWDDVDNDRAEAIATEIEKQSSAMEA